MTPYDVVRQRLVDADVAFREIAPPAASALEYHAVVGSRLQQQGKSTAVAEYLGIEHGVIVTLGLPFNRTSVDNGTAFDIASRLVASSAAD